MVCAMRAAPHGSYWQVSRRRTRRLEPKATLFRDGTATGRGVDQALMVDGHTFSAHYQDGRMGMEPISISDQR